MAKRRVLVVGGKDYNVPTWARRAFVIDLIEGDSRSGNKEISPTKADCIVVQVNYCSHNFSGQAHELGRKWKVPVLKARDGWSSAVAHAARNKVDWFVDAVQLAGQAMESEEDEEAVEAQEVVDNAWKELAVYERERTEAAILQMKKVQQKLDKLTETYERLRSGAADRVMQAVAQRAAEMKRHVEDRPEWQKVELKGMREMAQALLFRIQRLEQDIRDGVSSPPTE